MLIRLLLGAPKETAVTMVTACSLSLYLVCVTVQERVCVSILFIRTMCMCLTASLWGLCRQVGSDSLIPVLTDPPTDAVDIKSSKADLRSGSATSGQSLELRTERRSDVSIWGRGPFAEGVGLAAMMSLRGRALVLLVYGGLILQQSQAQVAAPAPLWWFSHGRT